MSVSEIRAQFPILGTQVYGKPLVYLDNAASAQRPAAVVDTWKRLVEAENANIHRAVHKLAADATEAYENTRECVRAFIGASSAKEIVFTSGATAAVNLVAFSFGEAFIHEGDEVVVSVAEHHSNIVPWQMLCERKKAVLKVLDIDENGVLQPEALRKLISQRTKIVAICHISNVLGLVNDVREMVRICHESGVPVLTEHRASFMRKWTCRIWTVTSMSFQGTSFMLPPGRVCFTESKNGWSRCLPIWAAER